MINVVLVDDEEVGVEVINILLSVYEDIQVTGKYTNPYDALDHVEHHDVNVLFLDIEMPGLMGTTLAEQI
ncbi:MAG TPA: response regulator, partial [Rummeliibacillus sp.]|nr:response regulator [Rummeliibacillus sp.]